MAPLFLQRVDYTRYPRLFCVEAHASENGSLYWRAWSDTSQQEADRQARLMLEIQSNGRPGLWVSESAVVVEGKPA